MSSSALHHHALQADRLNAGHVLLFLMLFVPTAYQPIKGGLLVICMLAIGLGIVRSRGWLFIDPGVLNWTLVTTFAGLFFCVLGLIRGGEGALPSIKVYFVYPWIYLLLVSAIRSDAAFRILDRVLLGGLAAIEVYSLLFFLNAAGIWPDSLYFELDQGQAIEFYAGFVEYNLYSISSLLFLLPYAMARLMGLQSQGSNGSRRRIALIVLIVLGFLLTVLSGRRALMAILLASPVISLFLAAQLPTFNREKVVRIALLWMLFGGLSAVSVFAYLTLAHEITWSAVRTMFVQGFDLIAGLDATIRAEQAQGLLSAWLERPLFGSGFGVSLDALVIAEDPWSYELQYLALMANTGVVGTMVFGSAIVWIGYHGVRIIREGGALAQFMLPILSGLCGFLLATATNQYLAKFDYLWVLFLPIAVINLDRLRGRSL